MDMDKFTENLNSQNNLTLNTVPKVEIPELLIHGYLIFIVGFFGIIGNILSIMVLSRRQMKSPISYILIGLAICDIGLIFSSIFIFGLSAILNFHLRVQNSVMIVLEYAKPILYSLGITFQTGSVFFTLCVTIERYIVVCFPFQASVWLTRKRAVYISLGIMLFTIAYNIPRWFELKTVFNDSKQIYEFQPTDLRNDPTYFNIYVNWAYFVMLYLIPFSIIVPLNILIYSRIRRSNIERRALTSHETKEFPIALMLVSIVLVFILCNILGCILNFLEMIRDDVPRILLQISNFLIMLNSSANFVIYSTLGLKFRENLLQMKNEFFAKYCPCLSKTVDRRSSSVISSSVIINTINGSFDTSLSTLNISQNENEFKTKDIHQKHN